MKRPGPERGRWPRGRFNGQRIVGAEVTLKVRMDYWKWLPLASWNFGNPFILWLCFRLRAEAVYGQ